MKKLGFAALIIGLLMSAISVVSAKGVEQSRRGGPGGCDGRSFPGQIHGGQTGYMRIRIAEEVATATGLSLEEILTQVQAGATLESILTDNGVDVEDISADLIAQVSELLAGRVAEGRITQEQADNRLVLFTEKLPEMLSQTFEGHQKRTQSGSI